MMYLLSSYFYIVYSRCYLYFYFQFFNGKFDIVNDKNAQTKIIIMKNIRNSKKIDVLNQIYTYPGCK